jgi:hypothetical protein
MSDDLLVPYDFLIFGSSLEVPFPSELPVFLGSGVLNRVSIAVLNSDRYSTALRSDLVEGLRDGSRSYFFDTRIGDHGPRQLAAIHINEP